MIEPPLPFGHAGARWFYVLLKGLVERGHRVTAFAACSKSEEMNQAARLFPAPQYDLRCYPFQQQGGRLTKIKTLRRPYSYMFSRELSHELSVELSRGFDILHLEHIWSGWLGLGALPRKVILNFHSLYDIDQEKQTASSWGDRLHRALRRRAEHHLLRSYETLLTLTPRLQVAAQSIAPKSVIRVVPLGLDTRLYDFIQVTRRTSAPIIGVIGSMNWYPSHSAAVRLLTRLYPAIKAHIPEVKVQIVGWQARSALRNYLEMPDVEIVENVPDMRPYFERMGVLLYAPERGSGMKVKILEAFALGVPVVTTTEGVEGIPAVDGVHAGVWDEDEGLIQRTIDLLRDREQQDRQRVAARRLVETHCGPTATLDAVERVYSSIVNYQEISA